MTSLPFPRVFSQIAPLGSNVLVKVAEAETQTAGGIILAESAQRKPTSGTSNASKKKIPIQYQSHFSPLLCG